jgi:hypothetical protein
MMTSQHRWLGDLADLPALVFIRARSNARAQIRDIGILPWFDTPAAIHHFPAAKASVRGGVDSADRGLGSAKIESR